MIGEKDTFDRETSLVKMNTDEFAVEAVNDCRSRRIRVVDYQARDIGALANYIEILGSKSQAGKIIVYSHKNDWQKFLSLGYRLEGVMNTYFRGDPVYLMSRFLCADRSGSEHLVNEDLILKRILQRKRSCVGADKSSNCKNYSIRILKDDDINTVMDIFRDVFVTYPSPVEERRYFKELTGREGNIMLIAEYKSEIAGIISADIDNRHLSAELTDCVTLPEHRGRGVMAMLIDHMEQKLAQRKLICLYSLARAGIPPINAVMYKKGYTYGGRLINNCDIGGRYENMNIWEKSIK
ncbi:putative beta-lysine N-acetyltransferase [Phosphitispora fastidiosa]|uniref:putative beta-lysine N-acetyltransferase n=1 Tax=Phosphitispora fastidiosa TaxID=2837202 RepID=UPI001E4FBB02|nr:putative beta-lysine N-acetyltransferase [Phosphitispora fastidiosa]MBU7008472.1 putative beta-lysine N-acetyltransferase [Phosphitispora fastidiosa]